MIARRQFIQLVLSALAAAPLPAASRALPFAHPTRHPLEPLEEELVTTTEKVLTRNSKFKVIGIGGGGANAVQHMIASGVPGVDYIFANTDTDALSRCSGHKTIQLHRKTLSARTKLDRCRETAELAANDIRAAIEGTDMLFITAGLGGVTGTGAAPVIARIAREMGITTVGVVTLPFKFEGGHRLKKAGAGLIDLRANVDSLIVVPNDKLLDVLGDGVTQDEAFGYINDHMKAIIGGIVEITNVPSFVNVDFMDVLTIMSEHGRTAMGTATARGLDRARFAAQQALACPMQDEADLLDAKGMLVMITAAQGNLKLSEVKLAVNIIRAHSSPDAHFVYGTIYDQNLKDEIRVTVVATGLNLPPVT